MWIALGIVGGLVGLLALLVVVARASARTQERRPVEAIGEVARSRGGRVTFDPDGNGFRVQGPRGEGQERMTVFRIMCKPSNRELWPNTIAFALRKYIPDAFDDAFARSARERLASEAPRMEALSDVELGARLRARLCSRRTPSEGLATCARPLGSERFEVRVVLDGFDVDGLPAAVRARFTETDAALLERALDASLPAEPPSPAGGDGHGDASALLWLARPARLLGDAPAVVVAVGQTLAWMPARPDGAEAALARLASRSLATGPAKGALFAWDGHTLTDSTVVQHSVMGPNTPDFTLQLPPALLAALGLTGDADGSVGVRRG
jgi:hypothetical protein